MIKKFSSPKIEYKLVAERSEANQNSFRLRRKEFWRKSKRDFGFRKIAPYS